MAVNFTEWWPSRFFSSGKTASPYAVLILNQPINEHALSAVINDATLVVCADGGANRLFDLSGMWSQVRVNAIVGDLDSLRPEVEEHFSHRGVIIEKNADQESTDFQKCLKWIRKRTAQPKVSGAGEDLPTQVDVVAIGGLGGRVDQGFSGIHHLYLAQDDPELLDGQIYLLSEQSLSFVLGAGQNVIHVDRDTFNENVGIIPVLGPAIITTKGLEWDVENWKTEFGGQISTSNHIRSDKLEISFKGLRPLFTVELGNRLTASRDG
jgi:thiamine pyrophosphokinase